MAERNYLIGFGERLIEPISIGSGPPNKNHPYSFDEARRRLLPRTKAVAQQVNALPALACPEDESVIALTLHPAYLAKSYFPKDFFDSFALRPIGSRARYIIPEHPTTKPRKRKDGSIPDPRAETAPQFFVAGSRRRISELVRLPSWTTETIGAEDLRKIEDIEALNANRIKSLPGHDSTVPLEVVLHANGDGRDDFILEGFRSFLKAKGLKVDLDRRLHAGGLCFLPLRAPRDLVEDIAEFSFLRTARRMARLQVFEEPSPIVKGFRVNYPEEGAIDPNVKVAVFDGGCASDHSLTRWVNCKVADGVGTSTEEAVAHGTAVTSALLFGSIIQGAVPPVPYARVDHWRVTDDTLQGDDLYEMHNVIKRIVDILQQRRYDFVNISIGPVTPIEDDEVHTWTAMLDPYLSDGRTVMTVAAGNLGEKDWEAGNARVQPCSDGVNAIGVGAADTHEASWARACYSSIGPGRSPGFMKPDVLAFGGCPTGPHFYVADAARTGRTLGKWGSSFAAPLALRNAIGMRSLFGQRLGAAALRGLLIHHADRQDHDQTEVGWGRLPMQIDDLVTCGEGEAHIVFQGALEASRWIRIPVPVPENGFLGDVELHATFCYFTPVDTEDTLAYTRAGLTVRFRPNSLDLPKPEKRGDSMVVPAMPKTFPFFSSKDYSTGVAKVRADAHRWETVMRATHTFKAAKLRDPVFDVQYQGRYHGRPPVSRPVLPYALIITVRAPNQIDLYDKILQRYRNRLEVLRPQVNIPVNTRGSN